MAEQYIVDNYSYPIGKDIDGNIGFIKDVQDIVFSIVLEIDRICRKNSIPYALAFGSTLGLYNYQGFIPWDDDADIAIDFFDIKRLKEALDKDLGKEFEYICYEKDEGFNTFWPTFKVKKKVGYMRDKNYKRMPDHTHSYEGFFVDIVAFMGTKNRFVHFMQIFKYQLFIPFYCLFDSVFHHDPKGAKRRMKRIEEKRANKYKDAKYVCQSTILPFQNPRKNIFPREVIYPFKEYIFNGKKLYSFNDIKAFCQIRYGKKCLKKEVNGKLIDPLSKKKRKVLHIAEFHLSKQK